MKNGSCSGDLDTENYFKDTTLVSIYSHCNKSIWYSGYTSLWDMLAGLALSNLGPQANLVYAPVLLNFKAARQRKQFYIGQVKYN